MFRITSILIASDLSPQIVPVLRSAGALAALTEARLHVVHVVEDAGGGESEPRFRDVDRQLAEHVRSALPPNAPAPRTHVARGRAHEVIASVAEEVSADLIVIGPHRQTTRSGQALGTTADRLVRTSEVPTLIVHAPISLPLRCVLVPTDLSDAAEIALDVGLTWSAALRQPRGSEHQTSVHALLVVPSGQGAAEAGSGGFTARELHRHVDEACERTGIGALLKLEEEVAEGDPAEIILERAREHDADLVVLGTHGHGALARALIGSVSSFVARSVGCPVLLVPPGYWQDRREREAQIRKRRD